MDIARSLCIYSVTLPLYIACMPPYWFYKRHIQWRRAPFAELVVLPRCRLCRYRFEQDDLIVLITVDGRCSNPFRFGFMSDHVDYELKRKIRSGPLCFDNDASERAIGCHIDCVEFVAKFESPIRPKPNRFGRDARTKRKRWQVLSGITVNESFQKLNLEQVYASMLLHGAGQIAKVKEDKKRHFWARGDTIKRSDEEIERVESGTPLTRLLAASLYWYEPPPAEEKRRRMYAQDRISRMLHQSELGKKHPLPKELWLMIAGHLTSAYAIMEMLDLEYSPRCSFSVNLPVWASHVKIDGIQYISKLSNKESANACQIWSPAPDNVELAPRFYVLEDHMGIREVHLSKPPATAISPPDKVAWWRTLKTHPPSLPYTFYTDGTKLQGAKDCCHWRQLHGGISAQYLWTEPRRMAPVDDEETTTFHSNDRLKMTRLQPLVLNAPGCIGLAAAFNMGDNGAELFELRVHDETNLKTLYRDMDPDRERFARWQYRPLEEGETITEVWCQKTGRRSVTLAFRTSNGRTLWMGSYDGLRDNSPYYTSPVCLAVMHDTKPHTIWLEYGVGCSETITYIRASDRIDEAELAQRRPPQQTPVSSTPPPIMMAPGRYRCTFFTSAPLEDVNEVWVCRHQQFVTGLRFRYNHGPDVCVGSFRTDAVSQRLLRGTSRALHLKIRPLFHPYTWVEDVSVTPPDESEQSETCTWTAIPWLGSLEWWFNAIGCDVSQHA